MAPRRGWQGRNEIAIRMVTLIRVLGRTKAMPPIDDLAAECGVTKRTVYRDLLALEAARWPLPRREA